MNIAPCNGINWSFFTSQGAIINYQRIIKTYDRTFFLLGPWGTGKSTFLREAFADSFVINLLDEDKYHEFLTHPKRFADVLRARPPRSWVVIDEIQRIPTLLNEVHNAIETQKLKFVLCGSSARKLVRSGVNLLGGRASESKVFALVPSEYKTDFQIMRSLQFGDIPLVISDESPEDALQAYVRLYLKEEIQAEALIRNLANFARFLQIMALMNARVMNVSSLARDAQVKRSTIDNYISILEDTLLGFRLPAFEGRLRVKERSHPKFYFFDCGIVRALKSMTGPISPDEKGFLFETWVANYLRAMQSYQNLFDECYYWAAADAKAEVDFLIRKQDQFVAVEVKSSEHIRPDFADGLIAIGKLKNVKRRLIVYLGDKILRLENQIECWPLAKFIEEFEADRLFAETEVF